MLAHFVLFGQMIPATDPAPAVVNLVRVFVHPSEWTWRSAGRPHYNLWIALEGGGMLSINGVRHEVRAGSAFVLRPDDDVHGQAERGQRLTNFAAHLSGSEAWVAFLDRVLPRGRPAQLHGAGWLAPLCRHLAELDFIGRERHPAELLQGLGFLLVSLQERREAPVLDATDRRILRAVESIRQDPAASYGVEKLATDASLSVSQFTRRFRALTGHTPNRFVIAERIARAETYLRESDLTVEAIAERLGYSDVYFFSRQFRRFRGVPPSAVRRLE